MARRCPICKEPLPEPTEHHPFCSSRCRDVDLGNWLNESYRISRPMDVEELEVAVDRDERDEEGRLLH